MNNVIIHDPDGDEYITNAYEYYAENNQLKFRSLVTGNWIVIDDVDIAIEITGFLVEITCTYRHNLNFS